MEIQKIIQLNDDNSSIDIKNHKGDVLAIIRYINPNNLEYNYLINNGLPHDLYSIDINEWFHQNPGKNLVYNFLGNKHDMSFSGDPSSIITKLKLGSSFC